MTNDHSHYKSKASGFVSLYESDWYILERFQSFQSSSSALRPCHRCWRCDLCHWWWCQSVIAYWLTDMFRPNMFRRISPVCMMPYLYSNSIIRIWFGTHVSFGSTSQRLKNTSFILFTLGARYGLDVWESLVQRFLQLKHMLRGSSDWQLQEFSQHGFPSSVSGTRPAAASKTDIHWDWRYVPSGYWT